MAVGEILLLYSLAAGLTETREGRAPCKGHSVSEYWIGGGEAKLWAQFPPCIVLGSQGLALGMDPSYRNYKRDRATDRRQLQTPKLVHFISTAISIISNKCTSS